MRIPILTARRELAAKRAAITTRRDVADLIAVLDAPGLDIAAFLTGMGITGRPSSAAHCPITNYIHHYGYTNVTTDLTYDSGNGHVTIYDRRNSAVVRVDLPQSVRNFIDDFDHHKYPMLEES